MKTQLGIAALLGSLFASTAMAETYYVPGACDVKRGSLEIQNKSADGASLWVQLPTTPVEEIRYDINGKDGLVVRASEFMDRAQGFAIKTFSSTLSLKWNCAGTSYDLSTYTTPEIDYAIKAGSADFQILNLNPIAQKVRLEVLSSDDRVLATHEVSFEKSYETQRVQFQFPTDSSKLHVLGSGRLHSVLINAEGSRLPQQIHAPTKLDTPADQVYFLIGTKDNRSGESYVIGLQDPKTIETARQQISNPQLEKIIVAGISLGNHGVNRSFTSRDRSPYSWSVTRVDGFSDFALIDCDGSPDIVEENLMERIQTGGNICFWHYRVLRELTREQVMRGY